MQIGFLIRPNTEKWGGDLAVLYGMQEGLQQLGHQAIAAPSLQDLLHCDFIFITNSCLNQSKTLEMFQLLEVPFGLIGFHEDFLGYDIAATGLYEYVTCCLGHRLPSDNGLEFTLSRLIDLPQTVFYYGDLPRKTSLHNYDLLRLAKICIANSRREAAVMQRDCPGCRTAIIPVAPGMVTDYCQTPDDSFLQWSGLSSKGYILQVGRLQIRKNQLSTILATREIDAPLVFIATESYETHYERICLEAAVRWRKAPTIVISECLQPMQHGPLTILNMPDQKKLPQNVLLSAFYHAGLHIHPAFQELPGATFLEAAKLGTPSVASSWCTIDEYFYDPHQGHSLLDGRIAYAPPHHIQELEHLTRQLFGKRFPPMSDHPMLQRTNIQVAQDLIDTIQSN